MGSTLALKEGENLMERKQDKMGGVMLKGPKMSYT